MRLSTSCMMQWNPNSKLYEIRTARTQKRLSSVFHNERKILNKSKCFVTILFSQTLSFIIMTISPINSEWLIINVLFKMLLRSTPPEVSWSSDHLRVSRSKKIVIILEFTQDSVYWSLEACGEITDCESVKNQIQLYMDFLMLSRI